MDFDFASLAGLESFVSEKMDEFAVPSMAIAVVRGEEVVYSKTFGHRDVEKRLPADENTVYAIASLTKAMTATCVGMLVDEGKLSWDEPVATYLPEFRMDNEFAGRSVTLRDMLSHNTGMPRHDWVWYNTNESRPTNELVECIRHLKLNKSPRSLYEYNNLMYATAGYAIERVTGKPWAEFIKERLFEPLGMNSSSPVIAGLAEAENKALPYVAGKDYPKGGAVLTRYLDFDGMGACGTVNSTLTDMAKWASMNLMQGSFKGKKIISEKTLKEIHTPCAVQRIFEPFPEVPLLSYGLGWNIRAYRGRLNYTHSGGIDGFSTYLSLLPNENVGVVILANMSGLNLHFAVANTFKDHILGSPGKDWVEHFMAERKKAHADQDNANKSVTDLIDKNSPPSKPMEDFAGTYTHEAYGKAVFTQADDLLRLSYHGMERNLIHCNHDTYYFDMSDDYVQNFTVVRFVLDSSGKVTEVHIDLEKALKGELIVFKRQALTV